MPTYAPPQSQTDTPTRYCPGCGHGVAHRMVCEAIDALGVAGRTIGMAPVGCAVFMYDYMHVDVLETAHGRTPAVASAIKRLRPDHLVFSYQGDGDLASIGMAETIHAANRGENITVIFINNTVYGMTGGQMAPTTLAGQKTTTSPRGRDPNTEGHPLRMCELLATLPAPVYIERCILDTPAHIRKAAKAVHRAFSLQMQGAGYTFVELLCACPSRLRMTPQENIEWMQTHQVPIFPLGVFRQPEGDAHA